MLEHTVTHKYHISSLINVTRLLLSFTAVLCVYVASRFGITNLITCLKFVCDSSFLMALFSSGQTTEISRAA
jgi:hypothetical protein